MAAHLCKGMDGMDMSHIEEVPTLDSKTEHLSEFQELLAA